MTQKQCSVCRQRFPATTEYFHKNARTKDGLCYSCKPCRCKYAREWQRTYDKLHYKARRTKVHEYQKRYYIANKEKLLERHKHYRETHREEINRKQNERRKKAFTP